MPMGSGHLPGREQVPVEELARRKGVRPLRSVDELACPGIFESDEELAEFLDFTYAARREPENTSREYWPDAIRDPFEPL